MLYPLLRSSVSTLALAAIPFFLLCCPPLTAHSNSYSASETSAMDTKDKDLSKAREFTAEEMTKLREAKTVFVLRQTDRKQRAAFAQALEAAWDFNELFLIDYEELGELSGNYAYFLIEGENKLVQYGGRGPSASPSLYLTLKYTYQTTDKRGRNTDKTVHYCRIELFPDVGVAASLAMGYSENPIDDLYRYGYLKNWTPGLLQLYLSEVQTNLENSMRPELAEKVENEAALAPLAQDTLYIPHYALFKPNRWTGQDTERYEPEELFERLACPYVVLDADELSRRIIAGEVKYVFDFLRDSKNKFIRVYSLSDGKIYQDHVRKSVHLTRLDFKSILN